MTKAKVQRRKTASGKPTKPAPAKTTSKAKTRTKAKQGPRVYTRRLRWEGAELLIKYKTHAFGEASPHAHLEVQALNPLDRPLPITDTGYRSHFLPRGDVERAGGPGLYVRRWLEQEAGNSAYRRALDRWRQLDLFT